MHTVYKALSPFSPAASTGDEAPQFQVEDHRSPVEMLRSVCLSGYIPSFCTACYRSGRTGDRFMSLPKEGKVKQKPGVPIIDIPGFIKQHNHSQL
jgi:hypothetical protein